MQFNKNFLAVTLILLVGAFVLWQGVGSSRFGSDAKADIGDAKADSQNLADKMEEANTSLNKTFSGKETPIAVTGSATLRGPLVKRISSQGRVHSYWNTDVVAEVGGRIIELKVRDGMVLKKGDLIATVDDREYRLALASAEAKLLEAKANYIAENIGAEKLTGSVANPDLSASERIQALDEQLKKGLISVEDHRTKKLDIELETIRKGSQRDQVIQARTLANAEVEVQRARLNLEKCEIRAPFSGLVFQTEVAPGQLINGGAKLCKLTHMKNLVVKAQVLESEIGKIEIGRPATITFTALRDLPPIQGQVEAVSPIVNSEDKTVETIVRFSNQDDRIRPGMFADLKIDAQIFEDRLMVPKEAVLPRDDRKVVFKVGEDNRAKWLYVETGEENDQYIEILGGKLEPGDIVLVDNHFTMGHDTLVKVTLASGSANQSSDASGDDENE